MTNRGAGPRDGEVAFPDAVLEPGVHGFSGDVPGFEPSWLGHDPVTDGRGL